MKIHCIGDSHTEVFSYDSTMFDIHHIGPYLAYNFHKGHESYDKTCKIITELPPDAFILLSFGEIDCRCHVLKQKYEKNRDLEEIIDSITNSYIASAIELSKFSKNIMLLAPSPTSNRNGDYSFGPDFSYYGNYTERNIATRLFVEMLKKKYNKVVSIFEYLINSDNSSKTEYFRDIIHLSSKALPLLINEIKAFI